MFERRLKTNCSILATMKLIVEDHQKPDTQNKNQSAMGVPLTLSSAIPSVERMDSFLPVIVDNLGTELPLPEDVVIN